MFDLQFIWFLLIGILLAGYAILDGFDLGVGSLYLFIAWDDRERRILLNAIGPVWDGNEVWLLTGGGAIFAAFPKVYATVFSGFYLPLMLVLTALVLRAVSLEFRGKVDDARWRRLWDGAFAFGSLLPALLFGVAIGNLMRGIPMDADGEFAGTFLGLLNPFALLVGALSVAMFVLQGASWLMLKTEGELRARAIRAGDGACLAFFLLWVAVTAYSWLEARRLWANYSDPLMWFAPAVLLAVLFGHPSLLRRGWGGAAFASSSILIASLLAILGQALFPALVPSFGDPALALTIRNASSTPLTLKVMLVVALLGMPLVIAYTIYIYRAFSGRVVLDEHSY